MTGSRSHGVARLAGGDGCPFVAPISPGACDDRAVADVEDVGDAWEENADSWLAWTRTPGHDGCHELFNFPQFITLLPDGPRRMLDVGCGEGRVGRWLRGQGHTVVGIDSSATLADAARKSGAYEEVATGDASRLPWPERSFDLAVASWLCTTCQIPRA